MTIIKESYCYRTVFLTTILLTDKDILYYFLRMSSFIWIIVLLLKSGITTSIIIRALIKFKNISAKILEFLQFIITIKHIIRYITVNSQISSQEKLEFYC